MQSPDAMTAGSMPVPMSAGAAKARLRPVYIRAYYISEFFTAGLIYFALVASPWAFGTTQPATILAMDVAGFGLGGLLLVKVMIRWRAGYRPMRWGELCSKFQVPSSRFQVKEQRTGSAGGQSDAEQRTAVQKITGTFWRNVRPEMLTKALGVLTFCILAYCLIGALNARAVWRPAANGFDYFKCINWLPHSYDRARTWQAFWNYLALACVFWAIRDWLKGLSTSEEQSQRALERSGPSSSARSVSMPARVRWLLWVLIVNGAVLGLEGIAQRLSGTSKLLWFMPTHINRDAIDQFGPYAYRASAAQYFNLLWPVALGFWWTLHRSRGFKGGRHHALLVCGVIMAACPTISTSRGGALVTAGLVASVGAFLLWSAIFFRSSGSFSPRSALLTFSLVCAFFVTAGWTGLHFGWADLEPRMMDIDQGYAQREEIYNTAGQMAHDYPVFGTGPGSFNALFQLYRTSPDEYWPAQLHDDWLETRITWGWLGSGLIGLALLVVLARWFVPGGIHGGRRFVVISWLALAGCMIHARFDFPFQVYSIVLLFVALCAVLFTLSRRTTA